jgi:agmatinase
MDKSSKIAEFDPSGLAATEQLFGLPFNEEESDIIIIPVAWEATVSYRAGAAMGPMAILEASYQVDLLDAYYPDGWKHGFYLLDEDAALNSLGHDVRRKAVKHIQRLEKGLENKKGLQQINAATSQMVKSVEEIATKWLNAGKVVALLGGDHSTPLGLFQALAKKHSKFGILQIDAHFDLRKAFEGFTHSHASIMYNALDIPEIQKLVQVGIRDYCHEEVDVVAQYPNRIHCFYDRDLRRSLLHGENWWTICKRITSSLPKNVYISFDIDGLDPSLCPHTGTPVPGGLQWEEVLMLFETIVESGRKIIGFDLVEVSGATENEWDAIIGARMLYKLCNLTMASQTD